MNKRTLRKYAELLVKTGVGLKKGETLVISSPVNASPLAEEVVLCAYKLGAKDVEINYTDEIAEKYGYKYKSEERLSLVPKWEKARSEYYIEEKIAYLVIISDDPEAFGGIDPSKLAAKRRARNKALKKFRDYTGASKLRWTIAAYPNAKWAKKVFPELTPAAALGKLTDFIVKSVRLDEKDAIAAWEIHQRQMEKRVAVLNGLDVKTFIYKNSIGTDFRIDMPKGYLFGGGAEKSATDGTLFTANMPTEEVFSSPDRLSAEGTLVASMPLCRNGQIIKDMKLTFKGGKIIDFSASEGYENLKSIIETDEGSRYLGEIAFVGFDSPIRRLGVLFYETLFDENASCHFAIGDSYPSCIEGGAELGEKELLERGLNVSTEHVDFMVGTKDLSIVAETRDGKTAEIFKDGKWVF